MQPLTFCNLTSSVINVSSCWFLVLSLFWNNSIDKKVQRALGDISEIIQASLFPSTVLLFWRELTQHQASSYPVWRGDTGRNSLVFPEQKNLSGRGEMEEEEEEKRSQYGKKME